MNDTIQQEIKAYILREFLPGEHPDALMTTTPLVTGGILDSIATLKLVMFLEERYAVTFAPHEIDREHLDTLERIVSLLRTKDPKLSQ